jgi:hypothetical protein
MTRNDVGKHDMLQKDYATYHPSATFRSKEYKNLMFEDIADFARIVKSSYSIAP